MYENKPADYGGLENAEVISSPVEDSSGSVEDSETTAPSAAIPKPVFMRLLMLFGGSIGCLAVGIIVSLVTGDLALLIMSSILSITFAAKGFLLRRKINAGQIFSVSGVCVSIAPKMLGRYKRIELVDVSTGDDVHFILPKKTVFKIGHVYTCYFDNQIGNRPQRMGQHSQAANSPGVNTPKSRFISADMDLPTNGFLGFEDFGVYQEKPSAATITQNAAADKTPKDNKDEATHNKNEQEDNLP